MTRLTITLLMLLLASCSRPIHVVTPNKTLPLDSTCIDIADSLWLNVQINKQAKFSHAESDVARCYLKLYYRLEGKVLLSPQ